MPTILGASGVRARSRDVVSQVEEKLKLSKALPLEVLEATRSSLRVMKIRNPIGCFGKYDNDMKRACALLEYDIRDYNSNTSNEDKNVYIEIAMERLAKAAFMKLKDFRDFHQRIGNFRTASLKTKEKLRSDSSVNRRATSVGRKSEIGLRESSIPSLSIQLGAFVSNSSGVALRAQSLFQSIIDFLNDPSKRSGMHGLQDVQRNQSTYEAACFYLIFTSSVGKQHNNASIRRRRRSSKEYDDGDDHQQLDLETFMGVTKVSPHFQTIIDYVSELQNEIESKRGKNRNACSESSQKHSVQTTNLNTTRKRSNKVAFGNTQAVRTKKKQDQSSRSNDWKCGNPPTGDFSACDHDESGINEVNWFQQRKTYPNSVFKEWKEKVLKEACVDAGPKMNTCKDIDDKDCQGEKKSFEYEQALDSMVTGILARNGLL